MAKHRELTAPVEANLPTAAKSNKTVKRIQTKDPSHFNIYVNDVQVQTSTWDVRLLLGEITDIVTEKDNSTLMVNQLGDLRMSPQLAKRLTIILIEQLKRYEATFGQIPSPKD